MNNKAVIGETLMQIYTLLFLTVVFIIFIALFPLVKGDVGSVSDVGGDFFAERVLANAMAKNSVINNKIIPLQQALNNKDLREQAIEQVGKLIIKDLERLKIGWWELEIYSDGLDERKGIFGRDGVGLKGSRLQSPSLACWPYVDEDKINFFEVYLGDSDHTKSGIAFGRGYLRC